MATYKVVVDGVDKFFTEKIKALEFAQKHNKNFIELLDYKELRASEYMDYREALDGLTKYWSKDAKVSEEGAKQLQTYSDHNMAVKAKYPKP